MKIIEIETIGGIEEKVVIVNCINWAKTHSIIKMFDRAGARHALIYLFIYLFICVFAPDYIRCLEKWCNNNDMENEGKYARD